MDGWIKIYRSLKKKGWYQDSHFVHLWVHLLYSAVHKETEYLWNGQIIRLQPGQLITGRLRLARETGINQHKVDRILKLFKNEQQIEQRITPGSRLITIVNWNEYQQDEQPSAQRMSNEPATDEQRMSTNKEYKNIKNNKNEKNLELFEIFWKLYPNKKSRKKSLDVWNKISLEDQLKCIDVVPAHCAQEQWQRDNGKYIPHPSTWLNQRRFDDELGTKAPDRVMPKKSFMY